MPYYTAQRPRLTPVAAAITDQNKSTNFLLKTRIVITRLFSTKTKQQAQAQQLV